MSLFSINSTNVDTSKLNFSFNSVDISPMPFSDLSIIETLGLKDLLSMVKKYSGQDIIFETELYFILQCSIILSASEDPTTDLGQLKDKPCFLSQKEETLDPNILIKLKPCKVEELHYKVDYELLRSGLLNFMDDDFNIADPNNDEYKSLITKLTELHLMNIHCRIDTLVVGDEVIDVPFDYLLTCDDKTILSSISDYVGKYEDSIKGILTSF